MSPIFSQPCRTCSRRRFLQIGSTGVLGIGLADLLRAQSAMPRPNARATGMIFIWLGGGPATIDMWDPKPNAPREIRGEFQPIATSIPGVQFSELMSRTAKILDRSVLVRSLAHNIPDHGPGAQYVMTGNKPSAALEHPSIGSLAASLLPGSAGMPAYFTIGQSAYTGAGFLGAEHDPFRIASSRFKATYDLEGVVLPPNMTRQQFEARRRLSDVVNGEFVRRHEGADIVPTLSKFQQDAHDILTSNRIGKAFDIATEPESIRKMYGEGELGRNVLVARRLIEAGARFVTIGTEGWDTHANNFDALRGLVPPLDQALAALVTDLEERGRLRETLVVCGGEFGRTPQINPQAGRDHWSRAMSFFLAGGGLKAGYVHGSADDKGLDPIDGGCSPDDLAATLLSLFGFEPNHQVHTTAGRPIELFEYGKEIKELIA